MEEDSSNSNNQSINDADNVVEIFNDSKIIDDSTIIQSEAEGKKNLGVSKPKKKKKKKKAMRYWPLKVFFLSLFLTIFFSFFSEIVITSAKNLIISSVVLIVLIVISVISDMIGMAFSTSDIAPFAAMSSRKIKGAKICVRLIKNASIVNSICSDVIGDICAILSGAAGMGIITALIVEFSSQNDTLALAITILISSIIAAVTVSAKAALKKLSFMHSQKIVFFCGKFLSVFIREK